MPGEAELIMFAIRSALKLAQQSREAYVDATRRRELTLPLPNFPTAITVDDAGGYFIGAGAPHVQKPSRLADLVDKWKAHATLGPEEEQELMELRREFFLQDLAGAGLPVTASDASVVSPEDIRILLAVRQWGKGADPTPSVLQRVGGTLIEIGVDYFASVPGALNVNSTQGKLAQAVLTGLEPLKFSEISLNELPARLFVATLETVSGQPALLTGDPKVQELIKVTASGLAQDVSARVAAMRAGGDSNSSREERVVEWGELIFRSVLGTGGKLVLEDPKTFLGIRATGEAALVSEVGKGVLGLVLDAPAGDLSRVFSRESVDTVAKAALTAVAQHPEILVDKKDQGLRALLSSVAGELGQFDTLTTPGILPEVSRILLEKTGENLDLLWPDGAKNPRNHLLVTAAKTTLAVLTKPPAPGAQWKPAFARADLLAVTETVFDELIQNPSWLTAAAGDGDASLKVALEAALDVVRQRGTSHLGAGTAAEVLQEAVRAVATRAEFLDKMPAGAAAAGKPVIAAALDATLATIFNQPGARAAWRLTRADAVVAVVRIGLAELARSGPTAERVGQLGTFLRDQAAAIEAARPWDLETFATGLRKALGG
jgi:hypothetical protein